MSMNYLSSFSCSLSVLGSQVNMTARGLCTLREGGTGQSRMRYHYRFSRVYYKIFLLNIPLNMTENRTQTQNSNISVTVYYVGQSRFRRTNETIAIASTRVCSGSLSFEFISLRFSSRKVCERFYLSSLTYSLGLVILPYLPAHL